MKRPIFIARQAAQPSGIVGSIVAAVMGRETDATNDEAIAMLAPMQGETAIDIGTGNGRALPKIATLTVTSLVSGVDHSSLMCARARRHCRALIAEGRVRIEIADSGRLPFPDGEFDAALSVHTIYFWENVETQLLEIARVLKPAGRLVLGFRTNGALGANDFPKEVYRFRSEAEVAGFARAAGFTVQKISKELAHDGATTLMRLVK